MGKKINKTLNYFKKNQWVSKEALFAFILKECLYDPSDEEGYSQEELLDEYRELEALGEGLNTFFQNLTDRPFDNLLDNASSKFDRKTNYGRNCFYHHMQEVISTFMSMRSIDHINLMKDFDNLNYDERLKLKRFLSFFFNFHTYTFEFLYQYVKNLDNLEGDLRYHIAGLKREKNKQKFVKALDN